MRIKYLLLAACLIWGTPALSGDASPAKDVAPKHAAMMEASMRQASRGKEIYRACCNPCSRSS